MLYNLVLALRVEALCDFVEASHNDKIGIKDVAAAANGVFIAAWVVVLALEG